jgi:hypothetical protein
MLPPSLHPQGATYEWITGPTVENVLVVDPVAVGFLPQSADAANHKKRVHRTQDTQGTQDTQETQETQAISGGGDGDDSALDEDERCELQTAIAGTLPTGEGQRNDCLFELARWLLAIPGLCRQPVRALKPILRDWHAKALPFIATKGFDDTWGDFVHAWNNAKWVNGDVMLKLAVKRALDDEDNPPKALEYDDEKPRLLLRICWQIDWIAGRREWFLSCREAGKFSGMGHDTAAKRLEMFVADGHLRIINKGGMNDERKATVYDYVTKE